MPTVPVTGKNVPDRRAPSDKDVWVTIGKMQADHAHLTERVVLVEGSVNILNEYAAQNRKRLDSVDGRLDGIDGSLAVLPAIRASFEKLEAKEDEKEERAARRQTAVTSLLNKNQQAVGVVAGLLGASILERNGAIPLNALYVGIALIAVYVIYTALRNYQQSLKQP